MVSDASNIPTSVGTGSVKKESLHAMNWTKTGANYDIDHDVFDLSFCTVETMTVPACVRDGKNSM